MQIFINLNTRRLQRDLTNSQPLSPLQLDFKRGDAADIELAYVDANARQELATGSVITFAAKTQGKYDGPALVLEDEFTPSGAGTTAIYTAFPSFNTEALNDAFNLDGNDSNDVPFLDLMGEISWTDGPGGAVSSSETFTIRVYNDVIRGDEDTPAVFPDPALWMPAALVLEDPPLDGDDGVAQVEVATIVGSISSAGNLAVTITSALVGGSPQTLHVPVTNFMSASGVASAIASFIGSSAPYHSIHFDAIANDATYGGAGTLALKAKVKAANDGSLNIAIDNGTAAGITPDATSNTSVSGVAPSSGTVATRPGQPAIVNENDVYLCARVTPVKWLGPIPF